MTTLLLPALLTLFQAPLTGFEPVPLFLDGEPARAATLFDELGSTVVLTPRGGAIEIRGEDLQGLMGRTVIEVGDGESAGSAFLSLEHVAAGHPVQVSVESQAELAAGKPSARPSLTKGRVVDEDGEAVPFALVRFDAWATSGPTLLSRWCDEAGRFSFDSQGLKNATIDALAGELHGMLAYEGPLAAGGQASTATVVVKETSWGTTDVRVLDSLGRPAAGVWISSSPAPSTSMRRTDGQGQVALAVPPGSDKFGVAPVAFGQGIIGSSYVGARFSEAGVKVHVARASEMYGVLRDVDGAAVAGATIRAAGEAVRSANDGTFSFKSVPVAAAIFTVTDDGAEPARFVPFAIGRLAPPEGQRSWGDGLEVRVPAAPAMWRSMNPLPKDLADSVCRLLLDAPLPDEAPLGGTTLRWLGSLAKFDPEAAQRGFTSGEWASQRLESIAYFDVYPGADALTFDASSEAQRLTYLTRGWERALSPKHAQPESVVLAHEALADSVLDGLLAAGDGGSADDRAAIELWTGRLASRHPEKSRGIRERFGLPAAEALAPRRPSSLDVDDTEMMIESGSYSWSRDLRRTMADTGSSVAERAAFLNDDRRPLSRRAEWSALTLLVERFDGASDPRAIQTAWVEMVSGADFRGHDRRTARWRSEAVFAAAALAPSVAAVIDQVTGPLDLRQLKAAANANGVVANETLRALLAMRMGEVRDWIESDSFGASHRMRLSLIRALRAD